jgi:hypothetical protein
VKAGGKLSNRVAGNFGIYGKQEGNGRVGFSSVQFSSVQLLAVGYVRASVQWQANGN